MENPVIPVRIKMEWFILVEIFWKRINTFRGLPFSRFHRNNQNFLYHLSGKPVSGFLLRRMVICFNPGPLVIWCFANGTTLTHSSFQKHFQVQYHFVLNISYLLQQVRENRNLLLAKTPMPIFK